jgi:hypothetical protein
MDAWKQWSVALFAFGLMFAGLPLVPSWQGQFTEICHLAVIAGGLTMVLLVVTRLLGPRGIAIERIWSAMFLSGMPVIYLISWLVAHDEGDSKAWFWVELAGVPVYNVLAALGLKRSPWFLIGGIAAHGLAWDAWHLLTRTTYVPAWYSVACLLADVGLSAYLATRVPAWESARREERGPARPVTSASAVG